MNEQPIDLKASLNILWRRRVLLVAMALLGVCGGTAYSVLRPPLPTAVALVLLPPSSTSVSGAPTRDMKTEIVLATSRPVLSEAGRAVSPPVDATQLKHHVVVTALSQDILQVQVGATRSSEAETLANAVAADYIHYVDITDSTSSGEEVAGLQKQSAQLSNQIQSLQTQINAVSARLATENPNSATGQNDTTLLASLHNEQQQVTLVLDNVNSQIVATQMVGGASAASTRILQRATSVIPPSHLRDVETGAIGLGAGLLLGIVFVLMRTKRDRRLWRRSDLARAIGLPVLFSLEADGYRSAAEWRGLLGHFELSSAEAWAFRRMLLHFGVGNLVENETIRLVSFARDLPALSVGPHLALYASTLEIPTTFETGVHDATADLRAALATDGDRWQNVFFVAGEEPNHNLPMLRNRLVVSVSVVDRERPILAPASGRTLLVVSAGFTTAHALSRLALAAADCGRALDGIVIVNPEPTDQTVGGVHDGRPGHSPLQGPHGRRTAPAIAGRMR